VLTSEGSGFGAEVGLRAKHVEVHVGHRAGWLRASVLGANDGLVSVAGFMVGVAAGGASGQPLVPTGVAGLIAGAMSMVACEYVSVSSQADNETGDIARAQAELIANPEFEREELTAVYVKRGLTQSLAHDVATQLMTVDALQAHAQNELGITDTMRGKQIQAALSSAAAFAAGAAIPLLTDALTPVPALLFSMSIASGVTLIALGATAAWAGGASLIKGAVRVTFWVLFAMAITAAAGKYFGASA
jgi:vacuolar iron transporter family protein